MLRPMTPSMMRERLINLIASQLSPNMVIPATDTSAVPIPLHTAYATLTSIFDKDAANKRRLIKYIPRESTSFVESFSSLAAFVSVVALISTKMATKSTAQHLAPESPIQLASLGNKLIAPFVDLLTPPTADAGSLFNIAVSTAAPPLGNVPTANASNGLHFAWPGRHLPINDFTVKLIAGLV
jgi:hypothetical protein